MVAVFGQSKVFPDYPRDGSDFLKASRKREPNDYSGHSSLSVKRILASIGRETRESVQQVGSEI